MGSVCHSHCYNNECSDAHEHSHSHECGCSCHNHKENTYLIPRLIIGGVFGIASLFMPQPFNLILTVIAYIILGYDVIFNAVKSLFKSHSLDENFLMTTASLGAIFLGEYSEAVAVILLYQIGEYLSHTASDKTKKSIKSLLDARPETARVKTDDGEKVILSTEIKVGDIFYVGAGEKIAVDGIILSGNARLDTSSITGEFIPREVCENDRVLSGMMPIDGSLTIKAEKEFSSSALSKILKLVSEENSKKAKQERFITAFSKIYTPIVTVLALITAFIPPILLGEPFSEWIFKALSFLVISCPCALVISVPLTFFLGIGAASKNGVLIKNALSLESLSEIKTVALDKTGTLTKGEIKVTDIISDFPKEEVLCLAALLESDSSHPIAKAIKSAYGKDIKRDNIISIKEIPARGIYLETEEFTALLGNKAHLLENGIAVPEDDFKNAVYLAKDGGFIGAIILGDTIRQDTKKAIDTLKKLNKDILILTGDTKENAVSIANELGIEKIYSSLLPEDKADIIRNTKNSTPILFVGDGINDSPSIASATVGVSMGGIGSDAAIEASDVVIMGDSLLKIPFMLSLSKRTKLIATENIAFSIGVKVLVMILSLFSIGGMWPAIFADVGVLLVTILNAVRIFFFSKS